MQKNDFSQYTDECDNKANCETQTLEELETCHNEYMDDREVSISKDLIVVSQGLLTSYKLYTVTTQKKLAEIFETKVNRRYTDFLWLSETLLNKYSGFLIPSLPKRHFWTKINFEKIEFVETRRKDLEIFLRKILEHKFLRGREEVRSFIQDEEKSFSINRLNLSSPEKRNFPLFEDIGEFLQDKISGINSKINHIEVQNDLDKEIQIYKSSFYNLQQRVTFLIDLFEEIKKIRKNEEDMMNTLNEFHNKHSLFKKNELESLTASNKNFDAYLYEIKEWVKDFEAAIQAIERLENLEEDICKDKLKIEEMNFANLKNNNKRDMDMDIYQSRFDTNKRKLLKDREILVEELRSFDSKRKVEFEILLQQFESIEKSRHFL